ncbi:MAG: PQQ-binding-like beta-propeller repeat protein [Alphaproteobacteria bacterium]
MIIKQTLALGALLLLLAACSQESEPPTPIEEELPAAESEATDDPDGIIDIAPMQVGDASLAEGPGLQVYLDNCASCHEGQAAKAPHRSMLNIMSPESVYRSMTEGVMVENAEHLSDQEKIDVSQYLTGLLIGERSESTLAMCEGGDWFDVNAAPRTQNWGLQENNTRFVPGDVAGLSADDLEGLELKWAFAYPDAVRARSQPTIAAGAIFVGSHNGMVFALDRDTGCVHWTFQASAEVRTGIAIDPWDAGDAEADPQLYFGDLLGNVYSIKARSGELVWRDRPDDHANATITGTPSLHNGKLYVPISSLEVTPAADPRFECCTFRGSVAAYDAEGGGLLWKTYTIDEEPTIQRQNAIGTDNYGPSGAPIWNSPAIDAQRNQLYVGTGENYSSPATLTSDAIIAFDLDTGAINWSFQATPNDVWNTACDSDRPANCPVEDGPDFDFGAATMLATSATGRDLVLAGQKSGVAHALDPDTGEVIWQNQVGRGGVQGGIHFGMAAGEGRLYVPVSDYPDGQTYDEPARPGLYAVDIDTNEFIWKSPAENVCGDRMFCNPGISGSITASPGLVYAGGMDGVLRIHDGATGEILWSHDTTQEVETVNGETAHGGTIGGGAAPVVMDGHLYVSSGYGIYGHMPGRVLLVFGPAGAE